jgi:hypothetical protein
MAVSAMTSAMSLRVSDTSAAYESACELRELVRRGIDNVRKPIRAASFNAVAHAREKARTRA